ncbi:MAG: replicative DNA helicase [Candidatus Vogelbacteria bacterium CG10_big_fil_rev_8_21_14_0_10_51_16]|uniref:Replicative DNA helicase n=1 Tax=Candidatus Vogelbacteria bacterium CG10_big_fil_rev_8_21_14_0_10_51_16 TaxID=1975045 RepID=A0A2H0RED6_9BACT|nr:MAG: replicative DNA helicase [Candidatus Vogelbacteria bacterium CG10_big_fil_rev_8_21_14_0_10_51_16]
MAGETVTKSPFLTGVRLPPQNLDAERALLGSVMLQPTVMPEVTELITHEDFYPEKHRTIFKCMCELAAKGDPIDLVSVSGRLKEQNKIPNIGGASYLTELLQVVPSAANAVYYAGIIHKKALLRRLIESADHISQLGYSEAEEVDELIDQAQKRIFDIGSATNRQKKFVHLKDSLAEAWARLERLSESKDELRGVPTGFKDLDHKLAGLQKSDLVILAARPSIGKTSLALDIARQASCGHGVPTLIFSLEMSDDQLTDRMLASQARVDSWKLRTGKLSDDEEYGRIQEALGTLSNAPFFIDDESSNSIARMRSVARRLKSEHGLGLIIVDYLQLMVTARQYDSMVHQVTDLSRSLKGLARDLDVPVLALSQLNRSVEQRGGEPRLSDLRDSGSIEQDADVVLFIHREDKYDKSSARPNVAKIIIAKHRNGPTGEVELYFDEKHASFTSMDTKRSESEFGAF